MPNHSPSFFFQSVTRLTLLFLVFLPFSLPAAEERTEETRVTEGGKIPESWVAEWKDPPARTRPLQIVLGLDLTNPETSRYYKEDCGLGGLVVSVGGEGYIRRQENWDRFVTGAKNAHEAGLRLWIYDENGYPSLEADGIVLEDHPEWVSLELVWDKENVENPFTVRECYEFTHSCNNFAAARKYPNPLNSRSTEYFLEVTHARYKKEMGEELYNQVEAFFTDEPSMMAANLGQIPEESRKNVPTFDPLDPDKKNLPMLPWCEDLEEIYKERYGEELRPHFLSLFTGDSEEDKEIRARYWRLIEDLFADRYFGAIRRWCHENGTPVSSGHTLHEEILKGHVPLDGNKLRTLKTLDFPGLDLLNSDPLAGQYGEWLAAAFPCSAAKIIGQRRVMTEVSDFSQSAFNEKRSVPLDWMTATAAWQMAWGVTDFNLFYSVKGTPNAPYRNEASHKAFSEFVGRLNAILLDATPSRPVFLYYPIETLQREFRPVTDRVNDAPQSETMEKAIASFTSIGEALTRAQIPFTLVDGESILEMGDEQLAEFNGILFPQEANPPQEVISRLHQVWEPKGNEGEEQFLFATEEAPLNSPEEVSLQTAGIAGPRFSVEPVNEWITEGTFTREDRMIFLIANLNGDPYSGTATLRSPNVGKWENLSFPTDGWNALNPQTGEIRPLSLQGGKENALQFPLSLGERETIVLISPPIPSVPAP